MEDDLINLSDPAVGKYNTIKGFIFREESLVHLFPGSSQWTVAAVHTVTL